MSGRPRHRQASKRWRHRRPHHFTAPHDYCWKAMDAETYALCPHHHHSRQSASRCGAHMFSRYQAVRIDRTQWRLPA